MIPYEDVFFTGIVAGMYLKIPRTSVDGMMGYSGRMEFDREQYATKLIYSHKHSVEEVNKMWLDVLDFRKSHNILLWFKPRWALYLFCNSIIDGLVFQCTLISMHGFSYA